MHLQELLGSASDTLTGRTSSATATVSTVGSAYDWYSEPTNVQTLDHAKTLVSNISGQVSGTNLFTNPEALAINWQVNSNGGVDSLLITDNAISAPDGTLTAEKFFAANNNGGVHDTFRDYNLTAFETFDSSTLKFDTTNETFDTGAVGVSETQTFTSSIFVKAAGSLLSDLVLSWMMELLQNKISSLMLILILVLLDRSLFLRVVLQVMLMVQFLW